MKRAWRWTKRIVLGTIVFVLLVTGGALIFIHTDYGRDFVRRKAETALLDSFPGGAHIGRIEGSVFGTLLVDDLRLDSRDGKPMIVVGTAHLKISLLALVGKTVRLDRLDLEDVTFDKHPQPEMSPEAPETPKQDGGGSWAIEIPRASVLRGRVVIASATRTVLDLTDLEAQASISVDHGITIAAHALGSSAGKAVEATALVSYINGTLAFPLAVAKLDQANVFALAVHAGPRVDGMIRANVPAATAKAMAGITLPGDAELAVTAHDGNVDAKATMAGATVRALMDTDLVAKSAKGLVIVDVPEATRFDPRIAGGGIVTAAINAGPEHLRGMVTVNGIYRVDQATFGKDRIHGTSVIAIDAALTGAWLFFESGADLGTTRATAIAEVTRDKGIYTLTKSTVIAAARHVGARKTDLAVGSVTASVRASGRLYPKPQIKVTGSVGGDSLRYGDLSAQTVDLSLNAASVTKLASGHLDLGTVRKGDTLLGSASLDAHGSFERTDAGNIVTIDIDSHTITTASQGTWTGSGGHVVIDPAKITLANLHTGSGGSKVIADVAFTKATKDLTVKVDARQVSLDTITPKVKGMVGAHLDAARRGGRWSGKGHFIAAKLTIPKQPVLASPVLPGEAAPPNGSEVSNGGAMSIDVEATIEIKGRRVIVDATTKAEAGAVTLDADVAGPYDLTDIHAWKRLDRRAINVVGVGVSHVDVSKLRPNFTGIVDGKLGLTATDASGDIHISDVTSEVGTIQGDLTMKPDDKSQIALGMSAKLDGNEVIGGDAKIALPLHPFDPDAWRLLGKRVLKSADIKIKPVDIDPNLLAKLHIDAPYRARAQGDITLDEGADKIGVITDVMDLSGGRIKQPISVHSETTVDDTGVHATTDVKTRNQTLIKVEANSSLTLDTLSGIREAKLDGLITIPDANATDLVAVIGRGDVVGGKVAGIFKIGGVIGKPTGSGKLTLTNIAVAPSISGRKSAVLHELSTRASFDGELATFDITGIESKTATVNVNVRVKPRTWRDLTASVQAVNFDIAPAMAFAPGALSAAKGTITASLKLRGLDPDTGVVEGKLVIHGGRYPLSPLLGTLRSIEAELAIANQRVTIVAIDGKLGKGTVHANGYVTLAGSEPKKLHVDGVLTDISLVRAFQPTIGANVAIDLNNSGAQFTGDIVVSHGHVQIMSSGGTKLLDATPPNDIVFVEDGQVDVRLGARTPPTKPWLLASVDIRPVAIEVLQDQFQIRGSASGKVQLSLGQGSVGLDGTIEATRGDIDLLGTRSQLERGEVIFDGSVDPLVNVRVIRELDALTVTAQISGRASKPEVTMSSDSGSYTQGELYAFFVGGQSTGSDAAQAGYAAGAGYASSLLSKQFNTLIGTRLHLPHLDFNLEPSTATSSEGFRLWTWINPKWSLGARSHPEPRVDENSNEVFTEYHLRGNIVIEGQAGDRTYDSVDLVKRINW